MELPREIDRQKVRDILQRLEALERELTEELAKDKQEIVCDFQTERIPLWHYIRRGRFSYLLSAPVIYSMVIPAVIMDIFVTTYQMVCFPIYRIPKVRRSDYIVIDRYRLPYLNILQKFNCLYCGYFNGLIGYVREIAARTEQFWCPIRHARRLPDAPTRTWSFLPYGDGERLHDRWKELRETLRTEEQKIMEKDR